MGSLSLDQSIIGNPPNPDPNAKLYVYNNDVGLEPQVVVEQGGAGDAAVLFKTQLSNYTIGVDQGEEEFRITTSDTLETNVIAQIKSK